MSAVLEQLKEMGFEEARARKALSSTNGSIEAAMEWLISHQDEPMEEQGSSVELVDDGSSTAASGAETGLTEKTPGSYKCEDCGKLLRDQDAVMFHAAKTNHENFAESSETIQPMTAEERAVKAAELKEKLLVARTKKQEDERKEQIEKERRRREEGKLMIERKEQQKANELRQIAEDRRREKEEDKKVKQRILDQIKADREARKAKEQGLPPPSTEPSKPQHVVSPPPKVDYKQATLQIRLPSGEAVRQSFGAQEPLSAVRVWLELNHNPSGLHFDLMTPFPRKKMDSIDYEAPLDALGLVPSAVLVMTRGM